MPPRRLTAVTGPCRVAIIGASGFLGAHIARAFAGSGWQVVACHRHGAAGGRIAALPAAIMRLTLDLDSIRDSDIWLDPPALLINCAGYAVDPGQRDLGAALRINVKASVELVSCAAEAGVARLIHLGSAAEYVPLDRPVSEQDGVGAEGIYAATKAAGTLLVREEARRHAHLDVGVARPFGCYGPDEGAGKFIPLILEAIRSGTPIGMTRGEQIRDYTHIDDVAQAFVRLASVPTPLAGGIFNICSGQPLRLRDMGECLLAMAGADPSLIRWGERPYRPGDNMFLVGNGAKLHGLTAWTPRLSLTNGLAKTLRDARDV